MNRTEGELCQKEESFRGWELRTTDSPLATPFLIIIAGTGGDLSEGEKGGLPASRTIYEEGGGSFMVEVEGNRVRALRIDRSPTADGEKVNQKPHELHVSKNGHHPDVMATHRTRQIFCFSPRCPDPSLNRHRRQLLRNSSTLLPARALFVGVA